MGRHQRTREDAAFDLETIRVPSSGKGRHRVEPTGTSAPVKAATVAAATGAFFAVGSQIGAGTAAAHPGHDHVQADAPTPSLPFELPAGLLPEGVEIPAIPGITAPAEQGAPELPAEVTGFLDQFSGPSWLDQLNPASPSAVQPVSGTLTSDWGPRWGAHHGGIDIAAPIGTPIKSAANGTVLDAGPASGFGQWVRVFNDDGTTAVYGHVNDMYVTEGQRVRAGDVIASVGNRGQSTGPHLHLEIWDQSGAKIDPLPYLAARGVPMHWGPSAH